MCEWLCNTVLWCLDQARSASASHWSQHPTYFCILAYEEKLFSHEYVVTNGSAWPCLRVKNVKNVWFLKANFNVSLQDSSIKPSCSLGMLRCWMGFSLLLFASAVTRKYSLNCLREMRRTMMLSLIVRIRLLSDRKLQTGETWNIACLDLYLE